MKVGQRLLSVASSAEIIVVRAPADAGDPTCDGVTMVENRPPGGAPPDDSPADQILLGKRYANDDETVQLLCVKGGAGVLAVDGAPLHVMGAKPLPASD
jgi:hypothetical protein